MIPFTVDVELRRIFCELSRVEIKGLLTVYFETDPSNQHLTVPYAFGVRLFDLKDQRDFRSRIYEFAASRIPERCHGLSIIEVEIFRGNEEVYYERRSNDHQDRLA